MLYRKQDGDTRNQHCADVRRFGAVCVLALVVLAACSVPTPDYSQYGPPVPEKLALPDADSFGEKEDAETALLIQYEEAKAQAEGFRRQAEVMRGALAREGFRSTARWFFWAGTALMVVSALAALASFVVGPTIVPRKLAWGSALVGGAMLLGGYALIRWAETAAEVAGWVSIGLFAILALMAGVTFLPLVNGWFRRQLEAKGRRLIQSDNVADRVRGVAIAEAANPLAKRQQRYRAFEPEVRVVKPETEEVG